MPSPGAEYGRAEMIEEDERPYGAARARRKRAADGESAEITRTSVDDGRGHRPGGRADGFGGGGDAHGHLLALRSRVVDTARAAVADQHLGAHLGPIAGLCRCEIVRRAYLKHPNGRCVDRDGVSCPRP